MKKLIRIAVVFALLSLSLCGCSKKAEYSSDELFTENPFNVQSGAVTYEFGISNHDAEKRIIDYTDSINVDFTLNNKEVPCEVGTMIFVNGMLQSYSVDDVDNITILPTRLESDEERTVSVNFTPTNLKSGETVPVHFLSVLNPSFVPGSDSVSYGNNQKIIQLFPYKLTPSKDTPVSECKICNIYIKEDMDKEHTEKYIVYDEDGNIKMNRLENEVYLQTIFENCTETNCVSQNETIELQAFGGKDCIYRISMFINNELVENSFDGMPYIDMELNSDKICSKSIDLKSIDMELDKYNHLSFVAVPMDNDFSYNAKPVMRSHPVTLKKE